MLEDAEKRLEIGHRMAVGVAVIDAQAAAQVYQLEVDALLLVVVEQAVYRVAEHGVGLHLRDLRADVEMQATQVDVWQRKSEFDYLLERLEGDAKLVVGGAGGDVAMGVCIDVGIDAQRHTCRRAHSASQMVNYLQLGHRLHVEASHVVLQS